ncbi:MULTISPECIES: hypothetical protein [Cyanophyceae]|uniref:hypothetical protein n=1 Tax=Cyanophyceae TaxID=3028117 RepID=UPI0016820F34|nr:MULTISPECIES: hypothetical protein [Cyanophyceae]MBD1916327.1 hypothetical protein [Phormidium sp. FACHB-77]MBD2032619.1 hypothetical protein [Phormidium sp. FACHB-322]MBD2049991.1 hypothetical protein [Leptolyngbya sp. FACHB-60]
MTCANERKSKDTVRALIVVLMGLGLWGVLLVWSSESSASVLCRDLEGQQVCIETIKRSAKYAWEYRVVVGIDGKSRPVKRYDCRQNTGTDRELAMPYSEAALRQFICHRVTH